MHENRRFSFVNPKRRNINNFHRIWFRLFQNSLPMSLDSYNYRTIITQFPSLFHSSSLIAIISSFFISRHSYLFYLRWLHEIPNGKKMLNEKDWQPLDWRIKAIKLPDKHSNWWQRIFFLCVLERGFNNNKWIEMNGVKRKGSKGSPLMVSKLKCHFIREWPPISKQTDTERKKKHQQHHRNDVVFNFENVFGRWFGSMAYALNMCEARTCKQFCELFTLKKSERMEKEGQRRKMVNRFLLCAALLQRSKCDSHLSKLLDKNFFFIFVSEEPQVRKWKKKALKTLYTNVHVLKRPLCADCRS